MADIGEFDEKEGYKIIHYSVDDNNNYNSGLKANWGAKEIIVKQSWGIVSERIEAAKQNVRAGKISPIAVHMENCIMDVSLLAKFVELPKWRVKRHLKPSIYKGLSNEIRIKYANAFGLTVEKLDIID